MNKFIRAARLALVIFWFVFDVSCTIYKEYYSGKEQTVSIEGHAFGGLAGVMVGIFVLHNRKVEDWEKVFKIVVLSIFGIAVLGFILAHAVIPLVTDWFLEEGKVLLYCS